MKLKTPLFLQHPLVFNLVKESLTLRQVKETVKKIMGGRLLPVVAHTANLCWLKSDLPTLVLVKRVLLNLYPQEKCLKRGGLNSVLVKVFKDK
jgi:hypothetical protein